MNQKDPKYHRQNSEHLLEDQQQAYQQVHQTNDQKKYSEKDQPVYWETTRRQQTRGNVRLVNQRYETKRN